MQYVTVWRMHRARELIISSRQHIPDIAETVGYESEFSFSKAFKRVFDEGPGAVRRRYAA